MQHNSLGPVRLRLSVPHWTRFEGFLELNILQVIEACSGGASRHLRGLCRDLVTQGHQVTVAYAPHRADETFRRFVLDQNEIRFIPLGLKRKVSPLSDLRSTVQLLRFTKRNSFDVVHGHSSKGGAVARICGRYFDVPTVYTPHSVIMTSSEISRAEAGFYTFVERSLGHWATSKVIAVSEGEREFICRLRLA